MAHSGKEESSNGPLRNRYLEDISSKSRDESLGERWNIYLLNLFQPIYRGLFGKRGHIVNDVEEKLQRARINTPVEFYLTRVIMYAVLVGVILSVVVSSLFYFTLGNVLASLGWQILEQSSFLTEQVQRLTDVSSGFRFLGNIVAGGLLFLITASILTTAAIIMAIQTAVYWPKIIASGRAREIDSLMPDVVSQAHALSVGGLNILEIIEDISTSEQTLGEAAVEFQQIHKDIRFNGTDYKSAIENAASTSPSDELSNFLGDLLSTVNSGGDLEKFLDRKRDEQIEKRKDSHESQLQSVELFGEVYISLTILPLLLVIMLVLMAVLGNDLTSILAAVVYIVIPLINVLYFVLISTVTPDFKGNGVLQPLNDDVTPNESGGLLNTTIVDKYLRQQPNNDSLKRIRHRELRSQINSIISNPTGVFQSNPLYTFVFSIPLTIICLSLFIVEGSAALSIGDFISSPLVQTTIWFALPATLLGAPYALFYELDTRKRHSITKTLSTDLRKLANINESGKPLRESIRITGEDADSKLGDEFVNAYNQTEFGIPLSTSLISFNNRYRVPRLARAVALIERASKASNQISLVLKSAADLSEIEDALERDRSSRTMMQVAIMFVSFAVFLGILLLIDVYFLDVITESLAEQEGVGGDRQFMNLDDAVGVDVLSTLYIHAAILQGAAAGIVAGYSMTADVRRGIKYALALVWVTISVWFVAGVIF